MTAETQTPNGTEKQPRSREEMARHAIAMQLHSIRAACEAALASLALLDSGAVQPPARPTRRPQSEAEAQFFGKLKEKQQGEPNAA